MAKEAANKQPYILISMYESLYKERYNRAPNIDSIGFDRAKAVLEYYFKTSKSGHPIQHFLFNFDKLNEVMVELDKDKSARDKLLAETKQMVEEYEHRSSGN
jgi:hypothetical protein